MDNDETQWSPKTILLRQALDRLRRCAEGKQKKICLTSGECEKMCAYIWWLTDMYAHAKAKEGRMKWSKSLPDKIGWWFRRSKPKHLACWAVDIVYIYQQDGQFMVEQCTCHKVPLKGFEPESREDWMQDEWAGPIEEPEESKDA